MLSEICKQLRVDEEYWDIWGHRHEAPDSTKRAILAALGLDTTDEATLQDSYRKRVAAYVSLPLDPVRVLSISDARAVTSVRVPSGYEHGTYRATICWEDGTEDRATVQADALHQDHHGHAILPLPGIPRLGYHDLTVEIESPHQPIVTARQRIIVAPAKAFMPDALEDGGRMAGLAVSVYGLRSARNWGIGDFTDLARLARWAAKSLHIQILALNPLHAIHNREPYNLSPYLPLSCFYRNAIYIDVERVPEFLTSACARAHYARNEFQQALARLRDSETVDYEAVARIKRFMLRVLYREFLRREVKHNTARAAEFEAWRTAEGSMIERFSLFCALDETIHRHNRDIWVWPDWPEAYQDPGSAEVAAFARKHQRRIRYFEWIQWIADGQLRDAQTAARDAGMAVGLYQDLALATDRCGADLWAYRDHFVKGCRVGSPPDSFSPEGQDWAFPPPHPDAQLRDGYRLFVETIRKNTRHAGALRIDHVMRFYRLFWIPEGAAAKDGTYVRERVRDLLRILALESVRGRFLVVGEDLGTCPDEFRHMLHALGILSYRLFYFEKGHDGAPKPASSYERQALVSSTTHDLPTLAGFWAGRDIEARRAAGQLPDDAWYHRQWEERRVDKHKMLQALIRDGFLPEGYPQSAADGPELSGELHNAVIGFLVNTPSLIMLLNQEDLTKETDQQNLPGTTWQYPNWKRKMKLSLEQLAGDEAAGFVAMFRGWLERSGRASKR